MTRNREKNGRASWPMRWVGGRCACCTVPGVWFGLGRGSRLQLLPPTPLLLLHPRISPFFLGNLANYVKYFSVLLDSWALRAILAGPALGQKKMCYYLIINVIAFWHLPGELKLQRQILKCMSLMCTVTVRTILRTGKTSHRRLARVQTIFVTVVS